MYELKAYTRSPYNQSVTLGLGSNDKGGAPCTAEGHVYAFGCTVEKLRKLVFGLKQIGDPFDNKFRTAPRALATSLSAMGSTRGSLGVRHGHDPMARPLAACPSAARRPPSPPVKNR